MTVDTIPLGKMQLEIPVKSIPTHSGDLHLANHKVENVQQVDELEWKFIPTAKGSMSVSSVFKTMILVVFFSFLCCSCCLCLCCKNCWLRIMRWWYFDDSTCRTIVFKPKVVNSISTNTDG